MIQLDNGKVAIRINHLVSEVRAYDHVPDLDAVPDYTASLVLCERSPDEVEARLADGSLTRDHMRLIIKYCVEGHYRTLVAKRVTGRRLPFSKLREDGFWEFNLVAFRCNRRWRNI